VNFAFFAANSLTPSSRRRRRTEDRSQHAAHDLAPQLATDRAHRAFVRTLRPFHRLANRQRRGATDSCRWPGDEMA